MIKKIIFLLLVPFSVLAHGGEDHSAPKKETGKSSAYFSSEGVSDIYELFLKYQPLKPGKEAVLKLLLFLIFSYTNCLYIPVMFALGLYVHQLTVHLKGKGY